MSIAGTVYALGIENLALEQQLEIMQQFAIRCILDVRNISEIKEFSRTVMKEYFYINQIHYRDYSSLLSMDTSERKFLTSQGYMDFKKYAESLACKEAMDKIGRGVTRGYNCCILGFWADPKRCHRTFLAGHELLQRGIDMIHITAQGWLSQSQIEQAVVEENFPSIDQLALFDVPQTPYEDKLSESLKKANKTIGQQWLSERSENSGRQGSKYGWQ